MNLWQTTLPHNCRALPKLSKSSFCFIALLGRPAAGEGEERQPGLTAGESRGSGAVDPRAGASLEGASPGAGGAGQGGVKRAGLGGSGCVQSRS